MNPKHYGNTGCRVFKQGRGVNTKLERFLTQKIDFESQIQALFDTNSQNSIILIYFRYVDFQAKLFPILYPLLENSTTRITILSTAVRIKPRPCNFFQFSGTPTFQSQCSVLKLCMYCDLLNIRKVDVQESRKNVNRISSSHYNNSRTS